ncbi:ABC transporter ATP-binding protein [Salicibibacter cibi]|uniref:Carnitine transport ATP-binding protein OpuCA n=1 Tax=Salicibibacter cibi TaxID=2743001 RepID=A0A7T7CG73_9BACI|nr:ABC transporter ATP-binding protein [Salicibibacter cibi]QQK80885.1 ABC transporter ATP-binding protein [Salicibibacter cibi]
MTQKEDFIKLENLYKYFGKVKAVNDISINIERGELVSFIGPSGCGKTTLLRIIGGFHEQDSGSITLDQEKIDHLSPDKRSTGMVFQNYALFPHMTVHQNVEYGLKTHKILKNERQKRIKKALTQVQLDGYGDRKPSELSGGQQQRVAIARCLVLEPKVLLLDEPLSNLDANLRMMMREEIRRLKEELDLTIVFVTHDQEEALSISDRVIVLNQGEIQQLDEPSIVYNHPQNEFVAKFVGQANILKGSIKADQNTTYFHAKQFKFPVKNIDVEDNSDEITIMIRPERLTIDLDAPLQGEVIRVVYNGNYVRYFVDLNNTEVMVDEFNVSTNRYKKGDRVGIQFPVTPHYIHT